MVVVSAVRVLATVLLLVTAVEGACTCMRFYVHCDANPPHNSPSPLLVFVGILCLVKFSRTDGAEREPSWGTSAGIC